LIQINLTISESREIVGMAFLQEARKHGEQNPPFDENSIPRCNYEPSMSF
jgi:hypothetical protein